MVGLNISQTYVMFPVFSVWQTTEGQYRDQSYFSEADTLNACLVSIPLDQRVFCLWGGLCVCVFVYRQSPVLCAPKPSVLS